MYIVNNFRYMLFKSYSFLIFTCYRCLLRFPSTNIKIMFQALAEEQPQQPAPAPAPIPPPPVAVVPAAPSPVKTSPLKKKMIPPLKIDIPPPDAQFGSPYPSPTGTIRFVYQWYWGLGTVNKHLLGGTDTNEKMSNLIFQSPSSDQNCLWDPPFAIENVCQPMSGKSSLTRKMKDI